MSAAVFGALRNPAVRTRITRESAERRAEAFALFNVFATRIRRHRAKSCRRAVAHATYMYPPQAFAATSVGRGTAIAAGDIPADTGWNSRPRRV
ncbi:hypothetical protein EES39_32360 [Streptomyces sp. ADI92-24]|nr:hypothetical protein EES39_32360 [Streptomyces sp. ADI92-24]